MNKGNRLLKKRANGHAVGKKNIEEELRKCSHDKSRNMC